MCLKIAFGQDIVSNNLYERDLVKVREGRDNGVMIQIILRTTGYQ